MRSTSVTSSRHGSTNTRSRPLPNACSARCYTAYELGLCDHTTTAFTYALCTGSLLTSRGARGNHVGEDMMGMVPVIREGIRPGCACGVSLGASGPHLHDTSSLDVVGPFGPAHLVLSASACELCSYPRTGLVHKDYDSTATPARNHRLASSARGGRPISLANCITACATAASLLMRANFGHTETHVLAVNDHDTIRIVFSARLIGGGSRYPPARFGPDCRNRAIGYATPPSPADHPVCIRRGGYIAQYHCRDIAFRTHYTVLLRGARDGHPGRSGTIGANSGGSPAVVGASDISERHAAPRTACGMHHHRRLHATLVGDVRNIFGAALVAAPSA